ncbi:hypothetical protein GYMLUDRAFT_1002219 [Collybiopsis luxurians FD-317 M1]|nr:hypothetical protein GYMLUDRAFT_1002219 [Collybiopsis luxurians FD-317 M1]
MTMSWAFTWNRLGYLFMLSPLETKSTYRATRAPSLKTPNRYMTCVGESENEVTFCSPSAGTCTVEFQPQEARTRRSRSTSSLSSPCQSGTDVEEEISKHAVAKKKRKKRKSYAKLLKKKVWQLIQSSDSCTATASTLTTSSSTSSFTSPHTDPRAEPPSPFTNFIDSSSTLVSAEIRDAPPRSSSLFYFGRRRNSCSTSNSSSIKTSSTTASKTNLTFGSLLGCDSASSRHAQDRRAKSVRRSRSFDDADRLDLSNYIAHLEETARANMQRELSRQRELAEKTARLQEENQKSRKTDALVKTTRELALRELKRELTEGGPGPILSDNQDVIPEYEDDNAWDSLDRATQKLAQSELERELAGRSCQRWADIQDIQSEPQGNVEDALDKAMEELAKIVLWRRGSVIFEEDGPDQEVDPDGALSDDQSDEISDEQIEDAFRISEYIKEGGWVLR